MLQGEEKNRSDAGAGPGPERTNCGALVTVEKTKLWTWRRFDRRCDYGRCYVREFCHWRDELIIPAGNRRDVPAIFHGTYRVAYASITSMEFGQKVGRRVGATIALGITHWE